MERPASAHNGHILETGTASSRLTTPKQRRRWIVQVDAGNHFLRLFRCRQSGDQVVPGADLVVRTGRGQTNLLRPRRLGGRLHDWWVTERVSVTLDCERVWVQDHR